MRERAWWLFLVVMAPIVGLYLFLGLAISQAIAQAHGGLIEVTSKENTGTTFRLVFPANT